MNLITRFNNLSLVIKLIGAMLMVSLVPLGVVGFLNVQNTQQALESSISENFTAEAIALSGRTAGVLAEQVSVLGSVALNVAIREALEERNAEYVGSDASVVAELQSLDSVWHNGNDRTPLVAGTLSRDPLVNPTTYQLAEIQEAFPDHVEVIVTDARGATLGATRMLPHYYHAAEDWWQIAFNDGAGQILLSDLLFDERSNANALHIAVPVFSDSGTELLGFVRSTFVINEIVERLGEVRIGQTGRAMLLDTQGVIITDPNKTEEGAIPADSLAPLLTAEFAHFHTAPDETGEEAIFGHSRISLHAQVAEEGEHLDHEAGGEEAAAMDMDMEMDMTIASDGEPEHGAIDPALQRLGWIAIVRQSSAEAMAPVAAATQLAVVTLGLSAVAAIAVAYVMARFLTRQVDAIETLFGELAIGEFGTRVEVMSGDELGTMAGNLNAMLDNTLALIQTREERDAVQLAVEKLLEEVSGVAEGDLTVEAEVTEDITGAIADSFNFMIGQLRDVIGNVQDATLQVSSSANEIQTTAEHLSQGSEQQSGQIADTSAAIEEMAVSIQQVSENAVTSATVGEQALTNAQDGAEVVRSTIEGMNRIRDQVQETSKRIKRLGESSQEVGEIVQLIGDIADRTSILALNASIQAAMAGEAGRGFAVVAEEVEQLAERSTEATKQIETLIRNIQNETTEAVAAMESTTNEVVEGSSLADQAGVALGEIETVATRLAELSQSISQASQQQARGSESVASAMGDISEITQQTASGTKQAAVSINTLAALADDLRASVSAFKLPGSNGSGPLGENGSENKGEA